MKGRKKIIELRIEKVNNTFVIVSIGLTDSHLTSNEYLKEYLYLSEQAILKSINLNKGIVIDLYNDTYVITESFNENRKLDEVIEKLILLNIKK